MSRVGTVVLAVVLVLSAGAVNAPVAAPEPVPTGDGTESTPLAATADPGATEDRAGEPLRGRATGLRAQDNETADEEAPEDGPITETEPERTVAAENVSELSTGVPVPSGEVITPDPGLDPALTDGDRSHVYALVQFRALPNASRTDRLEELGYERARVVTEATRYARIPRERLDEVAELSVVRSVFAARPAWRVEPAFAEQVSGDRETVRTTVLTFEPLSDEFTEATGLQRVEGPSPPGGTHTYYGEVTPKAVQALQREQRVYWIDAPGDPQREVVQGRRMVGAAMAADPLTGPGYDGDGVKVGVLDTGIAHGHRHFTNRNVNIVDAKDWADGDTNPEAPSGCDHGVHVAGTIAGSGSTTWYDQDVDRNVTTTVTGVAPDATLVVSRIFKRNASAGDCSAGFGTLWTGPKRKYKKVRDKGAKIISNSWSAGHDGDYDVPASKTDTWARSHPDTLVLFANGNNASDVPNQFDKSPGLSKNVISVGAVRDGSRSMGAGNVSAASASVTNADSRTLNSIGPAKDIRCGSNRKKPELYAPGHWTTAPVTGGEYDTKLGTSMATPHVAGVAALFREKYPGARATEVRAQLVATAAPPEYEGYGVVNANNALFTNPYESAHGHAAGDVKKGQSDETSFSVPNDAEKVVVTLVWNDPGRTPGLGPGVNCNFKGSGILANDLDLYAGPSSDVKRHENRNDNNVKRIVVDNPDNGSWTAKVSAHRAGTEQNYDLVYRVVTDEPTLALDVPDRVVAPADAGNETVAFTIEGTGAPVTGIRGDIDNGSKVSFCNNSGQFVAGTLSDGHEFTVERCLDVPDEPGTYDVTLKLDTTNAQTIADPDVANGTSRITKTVEVVVPGPSVHLDPYVRNASVGERVSYEVVMSNVSGGVGSYDATVTMLDPSVGRFVDGTVAPSASSPTVTTISGGDQIRLEGSDLDTDDYGNVTIGIVTAEGESVGASGINVHFDRYRNETGGSQTVENATYRGTWHGILNLSPGPEPTLPIEISTDDGDDGSIAGPIGVGEPILIRINRSLVEEEVEADAEIEGVEIDLGDGESASGIETEHSYEEPGNYTIVAEVALSNGELLEFARDIEVTTEDDSDDDGDPGTDTATDDDDSGTDTATADGTGETPTTEQPDEESTPAPPATGTTGGEGPGFGGLAALAAILAAVLLARRR